MKKLLSLILALSLTVALGLTGLALRAGEEYDNMDFFDVKESNSTLLPGQDYYFPTDWEGTPIDDDFFKYFNVSVSVSSDDDDVSSAKVRSRVDKAEFVKNEQTGDYLFHFRASTSFSYIDDLPVHIKVLAKDKENTDKRSWYEFDLIVSYSDSEVSSIVDEQQYDVDNNSPAIEFDEKLKQCQLNFDNGSFYTVRLGTSLRKFNFGYSTIDNQFIVEANPGASMSFIHFYARPRFSSEEVLKLKMPTDKKYLYEIKPDNTLELKSQDNNGGFFGISTRSLGAYVASDVQLKSATTRPGFSSNNPNMNDGTSPVNPSSPSPTTPASSSLEALKKLVSTNFTNPFVLLSNGTEYTLADRDTTLAATVNLTGLDVNNLYLYAYDAVNNRLIQSVNRPKVDANGKLVFSTNTKGYYVVSSGVLAK